jgi:hypothetical protein
VALFDGNLSPKAVLALAPRKLRTAGLSGSKVASIRDPLMIIVQCRSAA